MEDRSVEQMCMASMHAVPPVENHCILCMLVNKNQLDRKTDESLIASEQGTGMYYYNVALLPVR